MRRVWQRFRPTARKQPHAVSQAGLFSQVRLALKRLLGGRFGSDWRGVDTEYLRRLMLRQDERLLAHAGSAQHQRQIELLVSLMLRTPSAARVQSQVDAKPRGYHHSQERIYELIDFNDAFVSTVLSLDVHQLSGFATSLQGEMSWFCKRLRTPMFSDEQYQAIVRGLGREIAVYLGAIEQGLAATMGSRVEDAKGVDMIITEPLTHRRINIDCKTPSAYRHRLEDLIREGRLSDERARVAEAEDYCVLDNGDAGRALQVVLFCVRPERYGDVVDFRFIDSELLGDRLRAVLAAVGTRI